MAIAEPRWEYFAYGVTSSIVFSSQTQTFTKPVGFIMGLMQNRINELLSTQAAVSSLTFLAFSPLTVTDSQLNSLTSTLTNLNAYDPTAITFAPWTIEKNQWVWQVTACA